MNPESIVLFERMRSWRTISTIYEKIAEQIICKDTWQSSGFLVLRGWGMGIERRDDKNVGLKSDLCLTGGIDVQIYKAL